MALPRLTLVILALVSCVFSARAQTDGSFGFRKVGSWPGFVRGTPADIAVSDNLAYIAMGEGGLCIVDVTSRTAPVVLSRLDLPGNATRIKITDEFAFLACGSAGLQIVNITNPSAPFVAGSFDTAGNAIGVGFAYPYAFIADGPNGVVVADLTNPSAPAFATQIQLPGTVYGLEAELLTTTDVNTQVTTTNRYLQVVNGTNGFLAYRVTSPLSPQLLLHEVAASWDARAITRFGRDVYWSDRNFISHFDFTRLPASIDALWVIDNWNTSLPLTKMVVSTRSTRFNPLFYLFSGSASYETVSSPSFAFRRGSETGGADVGDGYLYFLDVAKGLTIYTAAGSLVSSTPIGAEASRIKLAGDRLYVTDTQQGLEILTVAPDGALTSQSRYFDGYIPGPFDVVGSNVFLWTASTNLEVLDVSNITQPVLVTNLSRMLTSTPTTLTGNDVAIRDGFAYVSAGNLGLAVLDVANPAKPALVRKSSVAGLNLYSMNVLGTNIFASELRGLASIGINPDRSASVLEFPAASANSGFSQRRMRVVGTTAYFCDRENGLKIYDVSDPTKMTLVSTSDTPGSAFGVAVSGSFAFVTYQRNGILVLNISNPSNPTLVATLPLSNSPFDIEVRDNRLFVAHGAEGISVWDLVPKRAQTIDFPAIANKTVVDLPFTISASASSGLPVEFTVVSGPATIENARVTITGAGTVTIRASQPGNDEFGAVFADRTFAVAKAVQTINLPVIADKTTRSAPFQVSATANSGLPVRITVLSGPASIENGFGINAASVTITGPGAVTIRALQIGDNSWSEVTVDRMFNVIYIPRDPQTISIPLPYAVSVDDEPFKLPITSSSGLPVEVTISGPATLENDIMTVRGLGVVTITANQVGNQDFAPVTLNRTFTVYELTEAATANVVARDASLPAEATLPDADADGDGVPNVIEYIFNTDPTSATSMEGHITATVFELGGTRYLKAHYFKPRTMRFPVGIQVADFVTYPRLSWVSIPVGFGDEGEGDYFLPLNGAYQFPLIRFAVLYQ